MLLCLSITALVCLSVTVFSFQTKVSSGARGPRKAGRVQVPSLDPWLGRGHNDEKRVGRAPGVDGEERQVLG